MESKGQPERVPERVYWIRRAIVFGVPLLLVIVIAAVFLQRTGPVTVSATPPNPGVVPSPTQVSAASVPATPSASAAETPSATPTPSETPTPTPTPVATCDPGVLRLGLAGTRSTPIGETKILSASIINGGTTPCLLTLPQSAYVVAITSGTDNIWTTAHCAEWVPAASTELAPQAAFEFQIGWQTQRSSDGCQLTDNLRAGTYVARATLTGSLSTAAVVMDLHR